MKRTSHSRGQHAEQACCEFLQQQGLGLLEKNYRGHHGEIDLIMQDGNDIVFIEVRYRNSERFGGALESVTTQKQARVLATAEQYLQTENRLKNARIDVVAMSQKRQNTTQAHSDAGYSFEWIKNAF